MVSFSPNQALQATPVGASLEVLSRRPGVLELDRSAKKMKAIEAIKEKVNGGAQLERIGEQRRGDSAARFARRLGFTLPDQYWALLSFADGLILKDRVWFSFVESVDRLVIFQEEWMDRGHFWPLSDDGCGNYYCVAEDSSVVFFDTIEFRETPAAVCAASIDDFILSLIRK